MTTNIDILHSTAMKRVDGTFLCTFGELKNKYLDNSRMVISVRVTENETDCMKEKNSNCTRASLVASLNSIKVILHV